MHKEKERGREFSRKGKKIVKRREFVQMKKDRLRRRGLAAKADSKYTGRRRRPKF